MADLLDCTLRDGSYVNRFQFTVRDTEFLCRKLEECGLKYIEVGHGLGLGAYRRGGEFTAAATDERYLQAASNSLSRAWFGMFCIPGIATLEDVDLAHGYGMKFIRVGVNVADVGLSAKYIERAKKHGMLVCTNYMKSYVVSPAVFATCAKVSRSFGADVLYIVESAGGMLPEQVESYVRAVQGNVEIDIGYHGHHNLGLAVSNSLMCAKLGARFIDTCLQGLGRSAGNAPTEQVAMIFNRMGLKTDLDLLKLLSLGYETIRPIITQIGLNPIDLVSGYALFHTSYMPLIKQYSNQYCIDPLELIIELCKEDQVNAAPELVERIASRLVPKDKDVFFGKFHFERYYVNEQQ